MKLSPYDYFFLRLLRMAPFEHRPRGWRFGTKTISDQVVDRLVAAGRAVKVGETIRRIA